MLQSEPFQILVNQSNYGISPESIASLDVIKTNSGAFHVIQDNKNYIVEIISTDVYSKVLTLSINGNAHHVKISDKYDVLIDKLGLKNTAQVSSGNIKAPMPGLILDILVALGQTVNTGEKVVILEAMKMENVIVAPSNGIVSAINIQKGMPVEKGALLIEIS